MKDSSLYKTVSILLIILLAFALLFFGKDFLIPVAVASILAMLFLPLCKKLESKGFSNGWAAFCCVILFLIIVGALSALITWQVTNFTADSANMKQRFHEMLNSVLQYLKVSPEDQQKATDNLKGAFAAALGSALSFLTDFILILVYVYLFLYFRAHINKFFMMIVPASKRAEAQKVIDQSGEVAEKYLTGYGKTIIMLWILYGIGFSVLGVKNAILLAVICGILELVPFLGNVFGVGLTMLMAVSQGGGAGLAVWAAGVYIVVQFFQTYLLEPIFVGESVSLNPIFTIMSLIILEMVWGVPGIILAVPLFGILKIVFDHIEPLKPLGFLLGEEKNKKESWITKLLPFGKKKKAKTA